MEAIIPPISRIGGNGAVKKRAMQASTNKTIGCAAAYFVNRAEHDHQRRDL
jgi:hypothetical protein